MQAIRHILRHAFARAEAGLDRIFGPAWNPLAGLGALGFMFYWVVAISGIYLFIFFDTSAVGAYRSVEALTHGQWYLGGVMRSLHRYASDGMVVAMTLHLLREFALDRYRGARWFSWVTGTPILWLVFAAGITGYWLVGDTLAQYVAVASTEWIDWLPIFGEPIARNFLTEEGLSDRFFTLLIFLHIAIPLILLLVLWIHLQRMSKPAINPRRGLAVGTLVMLVALSFVEPVTSQGPVDLGTVPAVVRLDWFYLALYPLLDEWSAGAVWGLVGAGTLLLLVLPWLPPQKRGRAAEVDLALCNGCRRCADDCPFNAVGMRPRSDGRPFAEEAVVNTNLCTRCGICVGACPISTPFRRAAQLATAIDLPDDDLTSLRERAREASGRLSGKARILVFGCESSAAATGGFEGPGVAAVRMPCTGMLPPSFIDYVLSRGLADGVAVAGCREGSCHKRFGRDWAEQRLDSKRDPYLRARVPRARVARIWASAIEGKRLEAEIAAFAERIGALGDTTGERLAGDD